MGARWAHGQRAVTVNDLLDRHVVLDIECLDRIFLNAYVPILQPSGQVVTFMTLHLGKPYCQGPAGPVAGRGG